jgi:ferredoxin
MISAAIREGTDWRLIYGGRSRSSMAFLDEILLLDSARVAIFAEDVSGRPDFSTEISVLPAGAQVYACGPGPMLDHLTAVYERNDWPAPLHLERFTGDGESIDLDGDSFTVELARTGGSVTVESGQTILGVVRDLVPNIPFSCEEGYCGTCETEVLDGVPDHRDTYLTDDEREDNDTIMICVSRCLGNRLVLDL